MRAPLSLLPLRLRRGVRGGPPADYRRHIARDCAGGAHRDPRPERRGEKCADASVPRVARADFRAHAGTCTGQQGGTGQAMVFQRPVMLRRSALGNVAYGLKLAGVDRRGEAARWALRKVGLATSRRARRAFSPAASSSGLRLRAPGRWSRRCCFSTSPPPISIRRRRARSNRRSPPWARPAPRSSWSPTTSGRHVGWPTRSFSFIKVGS